MFNIKKMMRGSLLMTLLFIVSITLSGCDVDFSSIISGIGNFVGKFASTIGNVVSKVADVAQKVVTVAKDVVTKGAEAIDGVFGTKLSESISKVTNVIDKVGDIAGKVGDVGNKITETGKQISEKFSGDKDSVGGDVPEGTQTTDKVIQRDSEESEENNDKKENNKKDENNNTDTSTSWLENDNNTGNTNKSAMTATTTVNLTSAVTPEEVEVMTEAEKDEAKKKIIADAKQVSEGIQEIYDTLIKNSQNADNDFLKLDYTQKVDLFNQVMTIKKELKAVMDDPLCEKSNASLKNVSDDVNKFMNTARNIQKKYKMPLFNSANTWQQSIALEKLLDSCSKFIDQMRSDVLKAL